MKYAKKSQKPQYTSRGNEFLVEVEGEKKLPLNFIRPLLIQHNNNKI